MRRIGCLWVALLASCCTDSLFAYSPLTIEAAIARINRGPQSVGLVQTVAGRTGRPRIVGGTKATIEDVPYQVSLRYFNNHICGGSIISHSWILTAAHCLDWYPKNDHLSIRTGSSHHSVGGKLHAVFFYHLHENYDMYEFQWDVATVRIRTPMVRPVVPLPPPESEWMVGKVATASGWGYTIPKSKIVDELQIVMLSVVSRESCNETWDGYITSDMICAGSVGVDACDGDSGGPAVQDGVQYGIISWGASECGNGLPAVFTNVAHPLVRNFIHRTTMV